jgi:hypothetical protein
MNPDHVFSLVAIGLTVASMLAGCLALLVKLTWQASSIVTRLEALEAANVVRDNLVENACRASGCIEQLESGYERIRARLMEHDGQITELRIHAATHGGAE